MTDLGYNPKARIIKAEILWSKKCPFSCSFCGMVQNERKDLEIMTDEMKDMWHKGMENLANIGCKFTAIYGAEPLMRYDGLDYLISTQRLFGMEQTLITALNAPEKIQHLVDWGLNSLTVSYDMTVDDRSRKLKTQNGLALLEKFPQIDDRACVSTLMKENQDIFLEGAREVLDKGYWFLFDIVHPGYKGTDPTTGYNLSKCVGDVEDLSPDPLMVVKICNYLIAWKHNGEKVHASIDLLENIRDRYTLTKGDVRKSYHCGLKNSLGWVTIGPQLQLYACDDWQMEYHLPLDEMISEQHWLDFFDWRSEESLKTCPGCMWNTHFNTHEIIESGNSRSYIHNKMNESIRK